jgi:hypothetical protein
MSILTALSKVLEAIVKEDLELHLNNVGALPNTQHGFRQGRSCMTALAAAHACWMAGGNKIVGILAFDLTAAFDTVAKAQLIPKLARLGISGRALKWFESYMSGGRQAVVWNGVKSTFVDIVYGVRQGSILGPILYNIHVTDMPLCLAVGEECNTGYADDTGAWQVGDSLEYVRSSLQKVAYRFAAYTKGNGLSLNAAKTQLLYNKRGSEYTVVVDGSVITPSSSLELLGVRYDQQLTNRPYLKALVTAVRTRSSLVARLSHHLPRGPLLRQIATGLVEGKIGHALAAVAALRLACERASGYMASLQVALNDVARTITGGDRSDRTRVVTLLERAKLPSVNRMVVSTIGMEAWKAYWSSDGGDGCRNPVGAMLFDGAIGDTVTCERSSRSAAVGQTRVPLQGHNTFISYAAGIWNSCPALREARSKGAAKRAMSAFLETVPL